MPSDRGQRFEELITFAVQLAYVPNGFTPRVFAPLRLNSEGRQRCRWEPSKLNNRELSQRSANSVNRLAGRTGLYTSKIGEIMPADPVREKLPDAYKFFNT
jgi:hypothetical protein